MECSPACLLSLVVKSKITTASNIKVTHSKDVYMYCKQLHTGNDVSCFAVVLVICSTVSCSGPCNLTYNDMPSAAVAFVVI